MKEQFMEFLFKRISTKIDDAYNVDDLNEVDNYLDDICSYVNELKGIVLENVKEVNLIGLFHWFL